MKYNKNVDILFLLFTMSKCEKKKYIEKTLFVSAGTQKCEKQHVLGVLYPNINQILKVNFQ